MGEPRLSVRIANDGMRATLQIHAGPVAGEAELRAALLAAGVRSGIDEAACARLSTQLGDELFTVDDAPIAQGQPAEPGRDGYFVPAFAIGIQPGRLREDGSMDFLDRELLKPVQAGSSVGRLYRATPGSAGRRVDGGELPVPKTRECALSLGSGVQLSAEGELRATRAGVVFYVPQQSIDVVQQLEHRGAVDLRSGHLDMEGSLLVQGSIERSFRVSASGDIEIKGGVEYGSVHAGGSVRVGAGVRGGYTGMLSAEGDVAVRYAEHACIACGGLLKLESAVNSELSARSVQITGKVRGGKTRAEAEIVAREAGVPQGVSTMLSAAIPLERPILGAKRALGAAKDQRMLAHRGLRDDRRAKGGKLGRVAATLASAELDRKIELAQRREALVPNAYIEVSGPVHPGVTIQIGGALLAIESATSFVRFSFDAEARKIRAERFVR